MFRSIFFIQYTLLLAISFISGVICFQIFPLVKSMKLISYIDPRILHLMDISILETVLPLIVWMVLILFFASHPYLQIIAKFIVAVRIIFFGFSSVYLLTQQESYLIYSVWWFPFQLIYSILLFVLCSVYMPKRVGPNKRYFFMKNLFFAILIAVVLICIGEILVIKFIVS